MMTSSPDSGVRSDASVSDPPEPRAAGALTPPAPHSPPHPPAEAAATIHEAVVPPDQAGMRLDKWLGQTVEGLSRARIQHLLSAGLVTLDGRTIGDASARVKPGQRAQVTEPPPADATPRPQAIALSVVYEDDDLIVVDKPAGLVVHPAPGNPDATLVNALLAHCGASLSGIGGERRPGIVHRLDKDTSGLMVAAKTDLAHQGLARQFADHSLTRAYHAVVWGLPVPPAGTVDAPIGRHPVQRKKMAVVSRGGKAAVTRYRLVEPLGLGMALVECRLATGRTHQVRVHMAHIGHPLVGDPLYGRRGRGAPLPAEAAGALATLGRQALHAIEIGFCHPRSGENLFFRSAPPADIADLIAAVNRNASEKHS